MMPYLLVALGLLFVWLEFYLPGGAFAVAAAITLLGALVTFFSETESVPYAIFFFAGTAIAVIAVIRLAIWRIKRSSQNDTFFLSKDQEGFVATDVSDAIIGKKGTTLTECGPSGFMLCEGKRYPVVCRGPYLNKGVEVEVIAKELNHYIVKPSR